MPMSPRLLRPRASGFDPRSISGLALWLDAADASTLRQNSDGTVAASAPGDPVGYWADKSGNGRHATQATGAARPVVAASALNGRSNLTFTADGLIGTFSPAISSTEYTFAAVVQTTTSAANNQRVFATASATGADFASGRVIPCLNNGQVSGSLSAYNGTTGANASAVTGFGTHGIFTGVLGGGTVTNAINGAVGTPASATMTTATARFAVGEAAHHDGTARFTGGLAEILYFSRALTTSERQRIERYLAAKWGITLAPQVSNADAQDWVNRVYAAGSTVSQPVANAVSAFVDGCQSDGIWDAMKSVVLLAGADTLAGALVPLKGTAPTNNNFVSGDYNRKTGLVGNGSTKYLDSNRNNNADPQDNKSFSVYVSNAGADGGVVRAVIYSGFNGTAGSSGFGYRNSDGASNFNNNNTSAEAPTIANPVGLVGASRSSSANYVARFAGSNTTYTRTSDTPNNANITLYQTGGTRFSGVRLAFYHIGESLNLASLDTRVSALYTAIGAAIP